MTSFSMLAFCSPRMCKTSLNIKAVTRKSLNTELTRKTDSIATSIHKVLDPLCSLVWFVNNSWNFLFIFLRQQKFLLLNIMHRWMFYKHSWLPWRVEQQTNKKIDKVKWCMTWTEYFIWKICCISATIGYFIIDSVPVLVNRTSFRQAIIYWVHFTPVARKNVWTSTWNRANGNCFHSEKSETRKFNLKVQNFKRILHLTQCQLT